MSEAERKQASFDLRAHLRCDAGTLMLLSSGFALSSALFSAVELGLFDRLEDAPLGLEELAERIGGPTAALERLVVLLHALGLLERDPQQRYRNSPLAAATLTSAAPQSLRPFLLHQQRHMYPLFEHLTDALLTGGAQTHRWTFADPKGRPDRAGYADLARSPEDTRLFLGAMNAVARGVGTAIAERAELGTARRLLDLGGGGGQIALELVAALPGLEVTIVDGEEACRYADEVVAAHGLTARVHTRVGDFLGELPADLDGADAILLGGVLADWDEAQRRVLLAQAHRCLVPGGQLLVSETLLDDANDGPVLPALLSLAMLVGTRGKNFTADELCTMLAEAGFEQPRVISNRDLGVRDLVIAVRR